jgi:hypothetical protein
MKSKQFNQCLIPVAFYSIASIANFSLPAAKTFQPLPQQQNLLSSHWMQPKDLANALFQNSFTHILSLVAAKTSQTMPAKQISQCLISVFFTEELLAIFSLAVAKTIQPMPDSNVLLQYIQNTNTTRASDEFETS